MQCGSVRFGSVRFNSCVCDVVGHVRRFFCDAGSRIILSLSLCVRVGVELMSYCVRNVGVMMLCRLGKIPGDGRTE